MFIPHEDYSDPQDTDFDSRLLGTLSIFPRKGGGGGGHGGGHSSGGKGGKGGSSSKAGGSTSGVKLGSHTGVPSGKTVSAYSAGGGKRFTLGSTSPFSGRLAGGGTRAQVYGNSRYGSGYPYGGYGTYINNRPLPYVFYPVPIYPHYYGSDTYENYNATQRPGGNLTVAILRAPSFPNTTEVYRIVGDQLSVSAVLAAVVSDCKVQNTTLSLFNASDGTGAWPLPEQIVQWYRASSFGLSLDSYNNSAALPSNMPTSNTSLPLPLSDDTPLPSGLNHTYLTCLNTTIGASVPLVDPPWKPSAGQIVEIIFQGLAALIAAAVLFYYLWLIFVVLWRKFANWCGRKWRAMKEGIRERKAKPAARKQYSTLEDAQHIVADGSQPAGRVLTKEPETGEGGETKEWVLPAFPTPTV
ncbi:hypothetical protein JAAARDRAFT_70481 [Jaapia argillacea MUCL 33604]|uniref:Uncharacterized protein n=1 Tax=Jaapia argillacea MUCL 33604 TaxID=933084 RepID=A0A067PPR6_9AGAM|nr:hypothetical protein JAAARDRAFT_70481 [Jaapia argillacea MUCL 33604]